VLKRSNPLAETVYANMRRTRFLVTGATYHVVARTNRQEFILEDEHSKTLLLRTIAEAKKKYRFAVTNICIMSNHVHLMITPGNEDSLSRIMQWILGVFAQRFNRSHSLRGHVWYDRFRSTVLSSITHYVNTFLYIAKNPVRAGIVNSPWQYRFNGVVLARDGPFRTIASVPSVLVGLLRLEFPNAVIG